MDENDNKELNDDVLLGVGLELDPDDDSELELDADLGSDGGEWIYKKTHKELFTEPDSEMFGSEGALQAGLTDIELDADLIITPVIVRTEELIE